MSIEMASIRKQFPQVGLKIKGGSLVYLDSAATTLKPTRVIDVVTEYYRQQVANVHRGAHQLADQGTALFEQVREEIAQFIGAKSSEEIIFTRGTTESLNLVARSYAGHFLKAGDEILLSEMEHHSNLVPWQMIAEEKALVIKYIPITNESELDFGAFKKLLNSKTKLVSLTWASNVLGTINPVAEIFKAARGMGAVTVLDAAQGVSVLPTDVQTLNCDFLAFSGHKIFAPTGIGVLYGQKHLLEKMPPYQGGGSMINKVTLQGSDFLSPPYRFEAGTPNISGVLGLGEALRFLKEIGFERVAAHEKSLLQKTEEKLKAMDLQIYSRAKNRANILSFNLPGVHASDVGQILDQQAVAVRTGHHCCQPLMERLGVGGVVRASFSIYSAEEDVDAFIKALQKAKEILL